MTFVLERKLPNNHIPWKFIFQLDKSTDSPGLACDLSPHDEAQFVDENGELVAVVIQNACKDSRIVRFVDETVKKVVQRECSCKILIHYHISYINSFDFLSERRSWLHFTNGIIGWIA